MIDLKEFRSIFLFLVKFLAFYILLSILYGYYIRLYEPRVDPITRQVTSQVVKGLNLIGFFTVQADSKLEPNCTVLMNSKPVISVYEGCNGINVAIVYFSFMFARGTLSRRKLVFALGGLTVLHVANLFRVGLLFLVALKWPHHLYFFHKYLFTAALFGVVIVLWFVWIQREYED
jgi:exosortase family protein XrtF